MATPRLLALFSGLARSTARGAAAVRRADDHRLMTIATTPAPGALPAEVDDLHRGSDVRVILGRERLDLPGGAFLHAGLVRCWRR
jgi:hypothetical protein